MSRTHEDRGLMLCTFRLSGQLYGVDVRRVQEVLRTAELTPVPGSTASIAGQINLRGQIASTIDLRSLLHLEPADAEVDPMHVVVRWSGEPVSLLVDRIGDVLEIDPMALERPPVIADQVVATMILGVYQLEEELLLVLDIARMVSSTIEHEDDAA